MDEIRFVATLLACIVGLTSHYVCACPADSALRAQQCFTDLARGVSGARAERYDPSATGKDESNAVGGQNSRSSGLRPDQPPYRSDASGIIPLDYRKIREYCDEGGHMRRFLSCVENLLTLCPELPQDGALRKLINPEHVRTSVPNLCNNVDKVEAGSECMNSEMNRGSECKRRAYNMIKPGAHQTTANTSSTFIVQCRFFRALVECQRVAVSTSCSTDLGDLHADFLLSFVPDTCLDTASLDAIGFHEGKGQLSDLLLGEGQSQGAEEENQLRQLGQGKLKAAKKSPEIKKPKATGDASLHEKDRQVDKDDTLHTSPSDAVSMKANIESGNTTSVPASPGLESEEISPLSSASFIFMKSSVLFYVAFFNHVLKTWGQG